jgi:hypothetical protein
MMLLDRDGVVWFNDSGFEDGCAEWYCMCEALDGSLIRGHRETLNMVQWSSGPVLPLYGPMQEVKDAL